MNDSMEEQILKAKNSEAKEEKQSGYIQLLKELYKKECLFVALSRQQMNIKTGRTIPVCYTKDFDIPSYYLFTNLDLAEKWCKNHMCTLYDGDPLVAKLNKSDYDAFFQTAFALGLNHVFINQGVSEDSFTINDFMEQNKINPLVFDEAEQVRKVNMNPLIFLIPGAASNVFSIIKTQNNNYCYEWHFPKTLSKEDCCKQIEYWVIHTAIATELISNKEVVYPILTSTIVDLEDFLNKNSSISLELSKYEWVQHQSIIIFKDKELELDQFQPRISAQDFFALYVSLLKLWVEISSINEVSSVIQRAFLPLLKAPTAEGTKQ